MTELAELKKRLVDLKKQRRELKRSIKATEKTLAYVRANAPLRLPEYAEEGRNVERYQDELDRLDIEISIIKKQILDETAKPKEPQKQSGNLPEKTRRGKAGRYAYGAEKRDEIARAYLADKRAGRVKSREYWANAKYSISGRTVSNYVNDYLNMHPEELET